MKKYKIIYIDAFTEVPFTGNPCAVLPESTGLSDDQMQAIARETNLNETAYVFPSDKADFRVRYFTPRYELPFAGHPTIATAFMLAQEGYVDLKSAVTTINLEFKIGVLPVDIHSKNGKPVKVVMTQQPPVFGTALTAAETAPCFGLEERDLRNDCPPQTVSTGVPFLIVPARSVEVLGKVQMDRAALAKLVEKAGVKCAFMFSVGGFRPEADTHARLFDPHGTSEDPYTGSAAGGMGAYIVHYGLKKGLTLLAEQGNFVHRPGEGILEIAGTGESITSVRVGGAAVKTLEGHILVG